MYFSFLVCLFLVLCIISLDSVIDLRLLVLDESLTVLLDVS